MQTFFPHRSILSSDGFLLIFSSITPSRTHPFGHWFIEWYLKEKKNTETKSLFICWDNIFGPSYISSVLQTFNRHKGVLIRPCKVRIWNIRKPKVESFHYPGFKLSVWKNCNILIRQNWIEVLPFQLLQLPQLFQRLRLLLSVRLRLFRSSETSELSIFTFFSILRILTLFSELLS